MRRTRLCSSAWSHTLEKDFKAHKLSHLDLAEAVDKDPLCYQAMGYLMMMGRTPRPLNLAQTACGMTRMKVEDEDRMYWFHSKLGRHILRNTKECDFRDQHNLLLYCKDFLKFHPSPVLQLYYILLHLKVGNILQARDATRKLEKRNVLSDLAPMYSAIFDNIAISCSGSVSEAVMLYNEALEKWDDNKYAQAGLHRSLLLICKRFQEQNLAMHLLNTGNIPPDRDSYIVLYMETFALSRSLPSLKKVFEMAVAARPYKKPSLKTTKSLFKCLATIGTRDAYTYAKEWYSKLQTFELTHPSIEINLHKLCTTIGAHQEAFTYLREFTHNPPLYDQLDPAVHAKIAGAYTVRPSPSIQLSEFDKLIDC
eukprot:TRINITY_DN4989_c6_g1_i1.p1 TRINITY_DN4989_c6_g1~~TRINITY_DN4989_c6_g1_i1.p1  ORF type:complete len:386 (+),score=53.22 TRINITY_DN4989_c6_g1_i1:59-1159(+)